MTTHSSDLTAMAWRKSTYSQGKIDCVEMSDDLPGATPVRDSKAPNGRELAFPAPSWSAFVAHVT